MGHHAGVRAEAGDLTLPAPQKKLKMTVGEKPEMDKDVNEFRDYEDSSRQDVVQRHYLLMRKHQTVDFNKMMMKTMMTRLESGECKMTIQNCFKVLEIYVDSSDPDTELPNAVHAMQTAEGIRAAGQPDWFQLVGLIHDMGKIQFKWGSKEVGQQGTASGDQWALGGDTWVVGAQIPKSCVFPQYNKLNPDMKNPAYNSKFGIYEEGCGVDNLHFAFGHDEYMYQMLKFNKCTIPDEGLAMIRYHSCYPWHTGNEYGHFMREKDFETKTWVQEFNKFDLYTKSTRQLNPEELWPYYQGLVDKFCPGELCW
jgi:inositol oxygenase